MIHTEAAQTLVSTRTVPETKTDRFEEMRGRLAGGAVAVALRDAESVQDGGGR